MTTDNGELRLENLTFAYAGKTVLDAINLTVAEGEFVALLGASGCGKTTLLRLLAGLEKPTGGKLIWRGAAITAPSLERGIVFQEYSLFPWFSIRENVAIAVAKTATVAPFAPQLSRRETRALAEQYLEMVGLRDAVKKYPHQLSGGMRQRAAIARTLALGSPVLLMDEPFGALDPANRLRLQELLLEIWANATPRRTVVFVTHDVDEALFLGDRVVILGSSPGRLLGEIKLDFPRPRRDLFDSEKFRAVREQIHGYYYREMQAQLAGANGSVAAGAGI